MGVWGGREGGREGGYVYVFCRVLGFDFVLCCVVL